MVLSSCGHLMRLQSGANTAVRQVIVLSGGSRQAFCCCHIAF